MFDLGDDIYTLLDVNGFELSEWGEIPGSYGAYWIISTESGFDDDLTVDINIECPDESLEEFIKGITRAYDNFDAQELAAEWTFQTDKDVEELMDYANGVWDKLNDLMNDLLGLELVTINEM